MVFKLLGFGKCKECTKHEEFIKLLEETVETQQELISEYRAKTGSVEYLTILVCAIAELGCEGELPKEEILKLLKEKTSFYRKDIEACKREVKRANWEIINEA
ncbi:hypothetical protein DRV66_10050 [Salmonella enterica subsp. enterica serovar Chester]|nr:hypothetical protein [Salmonella enterica subsp. enterica serovar Chester]EFW7964776.1 hypothetical protein [Shigella sonnei]MLM10840.1 hypothetical protein [Salmonella enterica subsp. enterica serovar Bareilly]